MNEISEVVPQKRAGLPKSLANIAGLVIALVVIFVFFCFEVPNSFPTARNIETLARQGAITTLVALGMTFVIVSGGIDLSVGSVAAFASVVVAAVLKAGHPAWEAAVLGVLAGGLCGLINGTMISRGKIIPFIATLGTYLAIRGGAKGLAHEQKIDAPESWLDNLLASLAPSEKWQIVPSGVWLTILLACFMGWVLRYTRFGRHVVAVGSNEHAARLCGVPNDRVKLFVYILSGVFAGLAGLMYFSRLTVGDPTIAQGLELDAIAATVIGGASLAGGEGTIFGAVLGALIMTTLRSGASQMGLPNWIQEIVTGAIIVLAVSLDRLRKARK